MKDSNEGAVCAIIVAAGKGSRMGLGFNKVLAPLCGIPVLVRGIKVFIDSAMVDQIILVINPDDEMVIREKTLGLPVELVYGGKERQESVYNGLKRVSKEIGIVLIHDGARPFINNEIIARSIENAYLYGAACAGMPVKDTIKMVDPNGYVSASPERATVWGAQTPQAFKLEIILKAHENAINNNIKGTDDAMLVEAMGTRVKLFEGSYQNIKITSREDLQYAEFLVNNVL